MLFNSLGYLFLFLPAVVVIYYLLKRSRLAGRSNLWLVLASLFFYSHWNPIYLPLLLTSILFNFTCGKYLSDRQASNRRWILPLGICFNVCLLAYFKYADFILDNLNMALGLSLPAAKIVLPLAISFFTFQQIAYLVDRHQRETSESSPLNYSLFVCFFPQLIAGPIVHHRQMMPQFKELQSQALQLPNLARGSFLLCLGLFKKCVVADSFAFWVKQWFDCQRELNLLEAWCASLSYTVQLYFDFSGYTDMALGSALLFGITLPINFNSPYKAVNIQDFWRRWHITLSTWIKDYLYIPMGGNRKGPTLAMVFAMLSMLIAGLWHGAGWTFVLWGAMHGLALTTLRLWKRTGVTLPPLMSLAITFFFVNGAWVVFRATTLDHALRLYRGMLGLGLPVGADFGLPPVPILTGHELPFLPAAVLVFAVTWLAPNSVQIAHYLPYQGRLKFQPSVATGVWAGLAGALGVLTLLLVEGSEFLYFNF